MCYNCGCSIPDDEMGDRRNITDSVLVAVSVKKHLDLLSLKQSLYDYLNKNLHNDQDFEKIFHEASLAWGQSIAEAKKETKKLLGANFR